MLCLKYPEPEEVSQVHPAGSVFVLPPQGQPGASRATRDNLERLRGHLQKQLGPVTRICCQPQRVGVNSSVAVALEGRSGQQVNLLLTVSGHEGWPSEEEYAHPRWYIPVTDAADLCYLLLWLAELK
ncbi:TPA: acetyltransferase [Escherichia coli]|uniref:acetyltransferase n=2 Tax=Escherichia coli TaxID=562 RepID=UPI0015E551E0|nr:acetyltransferase [Escherichia coli]EFN9269306.1 acetyltransferase [Escherichia coli]EIA0301824.1 acetyltransferase [Escherichia coli]MBA8376652.1 acetyltransferase [Escherichia coli]MBA8384131.1 acetyltransferase [Escherichia coli]MCV9097364.1 acetyltransferase [Escherichia coli]